MPSFPKSLQSRLILRLILFYSALITLVLMIQVYEATQTVRRLSDIELSSRANDIAAYLRTDDADDLQRDLPAELAARYSQKSRDFIFAVKNAEGVVAYASHPEVVDLVQDWPSPGDDPDFFILEDFGSDDTELYGFIEEVETPRGVFSIMVARARDLDELIEAIVQEIIADMAWAIPLSVAATIGICIWTIRSGMRPLLRLSQSAQQLGPEALHQRLSDAHIPVEVKPLVEAINAGLERLQQGFEVQRRVAANAAHELRTPLSILRARVSQGGTDLDIAALQKDVERMSRVVDQLLQLARIEAIPNKTSRRTDLVATTADVVANLAPLAIARRRRVGLEHGEGPVWVEVEAEALSAAIRNLVENGLRFTPEGTEVQVTVKDDGSVRVCDSGPGVKSWERERIFEPFWRGHASETEGSGLGLAIVAETVKRFNGTISIGESESGGARFLIRFPLAPLRS